MFEPTHENAQNYVSSRWMPCRFLSSRLYETTWRLLYFRTNLYLPSDSRAKSAAPQREDSPELVSEDGEEAWRSNRRNESDRIRSLLLPPSHDLLLLPSDSQLRITVHFSSTLRQRTPSISSVPHVLRYQGSSYPSYQSNLHRWSYLLHRLLEIRCRWLGRKHGRPSSRIAYYTPRWLLLIPDSDSKLIVQSADTHYLAPDLSHSCYVNYGLSSGDLVYCHLFRYE